jgi:hypothetical protein
MVRHYTTPVRWGREELDHGKVEQRKAATGEVPGKRQGGQGVVPGDNDKLP